MNISGYFGFLPENAYKATTKSGSYKLDAAYESKQSNAKYSKGAANSAQSGDGQAIIKQATANTLWQTQLIAQSPESEAIDAEEVFLTPRSWADQFLDFMNKTPEELMREAILKDLGYTEEELAAMDPKERAAAEVKIQEAIKIKVEEALREEGINVNAAKQESLAGKGLFEAA